MNPQILEEGFIKRYASNLNEEVDTDLNLFKDIDDEYDIQPYEFESHDEVLDEFAKEAYSLISFIDPNYDTYAGDIDPDDIDMGDSFYTHEDWVNEMKYQLLSGELLEYWSELLKDMEEKGDNSDYHQNKIRMIQDFLNRVKEANLINKDIADNFQKDECFHEALNSYKEWLEDRDFLDRIAREFDSYCKNQNLYLEDCYGEEQIHGKAGFIYYTINWGDWKHEHLRSKVLFEEFCENNGYACFNHQENVIEDDGSDCYSAEHRWSVVNRQTEVNEELKEKLSLKDIVSNKVKDVKALPSQYNVSKLSKQQQEIQSKLDAINTKTGNNKAKLGNMKDEYTNLLKQMKDVDTKKNAAWDKMADLKNSKAIDYDKVNWDSDNPFNHISKSGEKNGPSQGLSKKDSAWLDKQLGIENKSNQEKYYDQLSQYLTKRQKAEEKADKFEKGANKVSSGIGFLGKALNSLKKESFNKKSYKTMNEDYNDDALFFRAYITNLGKYNEGELEGQWVDFPIDEDEFNAKLNEIGVSDKPDADGNYYEEWFVTDYDTNLPGVYEELGEYPGYEKLQEYGELIEGASDIDPVVLENVMEVADSLEKAIDGINDGTIHFYENVSTWGELAEYLIDDIYGGIENYLKDAPDQIERHFDYEALGRDLRLDGNYEGDPRVNGDVEITISDIEVYNPSTDEYELKDDIVETIDYEDVFDEEIHDYTDIDDDNIDQWAKDYLVDKFGTDDIEFSVDFTALEDDGYQSAGEYWCGDDNASDEEIGEAFVNDVGFDGVNNPEYYFDYDSWGSDLRYDNFTMTKDGCVEME